MNHSPKLSLETLTARAAIESEQQHGSVIPPLHLSSNFTFEGFGKKRSYDYTRSGNPTRDDLARALTELEGGAGGVVTSSGMSAVTLATHLVRADQIIVAPHDCYGGTYRLLQQLEEQGRARVRFVDQTRSALLEKALADASLLWIETPSNPLLRIADIRKLSARAHARGAIVLTDNTFLSPALQRPIALGADLVLHSTTKSLNGHSDVVGGALIAASHELAEQISFWANCLGVTGAPFDSYLTLRGLRTLFARWRVLEENARSVAQALDQHPAVSEVYYPGLESHPGHELAKTQQDGYGSIISFRLQSARAVGPFVESLQNFSLAESLGGVESLVSHPATMTHASMDPEARRCAGIDDRLIRLSIGIESAADLVRDLEQALRGATTRRKAHRKTA